MKYPKRNRRYADVLEEIYDIHDSFTEDEYYDALYYLLGDSYPDADDDELEELFEEMLENLPAAQAELLLQLLTQIGQRLGDGTLELPNYGEDIDVSPALDKGKEWLNKGLSFAKNNPDAIAGGVGFVTNLFAPGLGTVTSKLAQNALSAAQGKAETAKNPVFDTLQYVTSPQVKKGLASAAVTGNPLTTVTQNGKTSLVPVATYLRGLIALAQSSLMYLEQNMPQALQDAMEESFGEDFAEQSESLVETVLSEEVRANGGWEKKIKATDLGDRNGYNILTAVNTGGIMSENNIIYYFGDDADEYSGFKIAIETLQKAGIMHELQQIWENGNKGIDIYIQVYPIPADWYGSVANGTTSGQIFKPIEVSANGLMVAMQDIRAAYPKMKTEHIDEIKKKSFLLGKGVVIINISYSNVLSAATNKKLQRQLALTITHEIFAHGLDLKDGVDDISVQKEHQNFYNDPTLGGYSTPYDNIKLDSIAGKYKKRIEAYLE
jgi:hypothetical protein